MILKNIIPTKKSVLTETEGEFDRLNIKGKVWNGPIFGEFGSFSAFAYLQSLIILKYKNIFTCDVDIQMSLS